MCSSREIRVDQSLGAFLSGIPNANAKSLRFTNAISQIATLPPVPDLPKILLRHKKMSGSYFYHIFYWFSFFLENKAYLMSGSGLPK